MKGSKLKQPKKINKKTTRYIGFKTDQHIYDLFNEFYLDYCNHTKCNPTKDEFTQMCLQLGFDAIIQSGLMKDQKEENKVQLPPENKIIVLH